MLRPRQYREAPRLRLPQPRTQPPPETLEADQAQHLARIIAVEGEARRLAARAHMLLRHEQGADRD